MKAMLFAAGLGTRLKPWTDKHPKTLLPIHQQSLLERNVLYLKQYGITEIIINLHHFSEQILETIKSHNAWGVSIQISYEAELLETGGGLKKAQYFFEKEENFLVLNADILTNLDIEKMLIFHLREQPLATLAVMQRTSSRYLLLDKNNNMVGWENCSKGEKIITEGAETYTQKAFCGLQILNHKIFELLPMDKKFSIMETYLSHKEKYTIKAYEEANIKWIDVGKPESIAVAEKLFEGKIMN